LLSPHKTFWFQRTFHPRPRKSFFIWKAPRQFYQ